jgi:FkbM family methyltransferase
MRFLGFRWRERGGAAQPDCRSPTNIGESAIEPVEFVKRLDAVDAALGRLSRDLDFVRNRLSCYLGDGVALTYLLDETPIFVNSNDWGCPANLINGGRYEEENLEVLHSFVAPDTVFIDIGANVGFFTLQIARRLTGGGRVYAFEPHPKLAELLRRNAYVNGLSGIVSCFSLALSDENASAELYYPQGHLGGGQVVSAAAPLPGDGRTVVRSELRRLDDVLGTDFVCDLVKVDVEGHEINVLDGMRAIVANSPKMKILFEKLIPDSGTEPQFERYFSERDFILYAVLRETSLRELKAGELRGWSGYVLAARRGVIHDGLVRSRFTIYPPQLLPQPDGASAPGRATARIFSTAQRGTLLFHGPYWFMKRGRWHFKLHGNIRGAVTFYLLERFGYNVQEFTLDTEQSEFVFTLPRDLVYFECAGRAASDDATIEVRALEFVRDP